MELGEKLVDNFGKVKAFCSSKKLSINTDKTQYILLKLPSQKLDKEPVLIIDDHPMTPDNSVELLGFELP